MKLTSQSLFAIALAALIPFTAQAQDPAQTLAYHETKSDLNSAEADIFAAMKALDEVGELIHHDNSNKAQSPNQNDKVNVDELLMAASNQGEVQNTQPVIAAAAKPDIKHDIQAAPTKQETPKSPAVDKKSDSKPVIAPAAKPDIKHDIQGAPTKQETPKSPAVDKKSDSKPVIAAAAKPDIKHDIQAAPTKQETPKSPAVDKKSDSKPVIAAAAKPDIKHDIQAAPTKQETPKSPAIDKKSDSKPVIAAAAKPDIKHDIQAAPTKQETPKSPAVDKKSDSKPAIAAAAKPDIKHDIQAAPTKLETPNSPAVDKKSDSKPAIAAAAKPDIKHDIQAAPTKQETPKSPAVDKKSDSKPVIAADGTRVTDKPQTSPGPNMRQTTSMALAYVTDVYKINGVSLSQNLKSAHPTIGELYQYAFSQKKVYQTTRPAIGDLAFFHNTVDRNRDGRWNDWHSLVGIVENVDENDTVTILIFTDKVEKIQLNLKYPELKTRKGQTINTQIRPDEGAQIGTSAKLFAGFANLLGDIASVTVVDNWKPGMKF